MPAKPLPTLSDQLSARQRNTALRALLSTTAAATHALNVLTDADRREANRVYIEHLNQQVKGAQK